MIRAGLLGTLATAEGLAPLGPGLAYLGGDTAPCSPLLTGYEVLDQANRAEANLLAVFLVNIPFTLVPLLLMWRMRQPNPFGARPTARQTAPG